MRDFRRSSPAGLKLVRLSQSYLLRATGLTKEAWRHWKTVLPGFADRDGRSVRFTPAEVVALAALAEACNALNLQISFIKPVAHEFFALVARCVDGGSPLGSLHVTPAGVSHKEASEPVGNARAAIVIDLAAVLERLESELAFGDLRAASPQLRLAL